MTKTVDKAAAQHQRFIETARELGCDEDEAAAAGFDEKLKRIATAKLKPKARPASKEGSRKVKSHQ